MDPMVKVPMCRLLAKVYQANDRFIRIKQQLLTLVKYAYHAESNMTAAQASFDLVCRSWPIRKWTLGRCEPYVQVSNRTAISSITLLSG